MIKYLQLVVFWITSYLTTIAQVDSTDKSIRRSTTFNYEAGAVVSPAAKTPFWLQTNQFGIISKSSPFGTVRVGINETFKISRQNSNYSISYGVQLVGNAVKHSSALLPESYLSLNSGHFTLWGGRRKEIIGLGDSTLTSGFYSWSGNALPITKLQIGTKDFTPLGFTNGLASIHAFFAHGWFANSDSTQGSYLHQKALYIRIGRPSSHIRFTMGILHNAQWGGRSNYLPAILANGGQIPNSFNDYLYVLVAREGNQSSSSNLTDFDRINRVGNHLGSIDFAFESTVNQWHMMGYYQHPFEDKSGVAFVNFPDGLYGIRLKRKPIKSSTFQLQHILFEYLNTMDQSGPMSSTGNRYDGRDDYFNNYQYLDGWVQNRRLIGTPFLTRREDLKPELQSAKPDFSYYDKWAVANNRVKVIYIGTTGLFASGVQVRGQFSYSQNYGTYRTPFSTTVDQFSGVVWVGWPLNQSKTFELKTAIAYDKGQLYGDNIGAHITIRRTWSTGKGW